MIDNRHDRHAPVGMMPMASVPASYANVHVNKNQ